MQNLKISLITTSYNSEITISDTLSSVLLQSYSNIEYIIVDGGSSDETISIIKEYEPLFNGRLKWISEKDDGIYDAMNKGIQMASGDIVGILNSDDLFFDSNVLGDIVQAFDSKIEAVCGNLYFVSLMIRILLLGLGKEVLIIALIKVGILHILHFT